MNLDSLHLRIVLAIGWMATCSFLGGCASTEVIRATELPISYRADPRGVRPPIDLSALARRSMNGDVIYPGDLLNISVATGAEEEPPAAFPHHVSRSGEVKIQDVGDVLVAGLTMTAAEQAIRRASMDRRIHRDPVVTVQLELHQMDKVSVVGAVNDPGVKELPRAGNDLFAAILAAGDLAESAGTTIEIRHPVGDATGIVQTGFEDSESAPANAVHVDLVEAMAGHSGDLTLRDGSVVWVKERPPEYVYVHGLVANDGEVELPRDRPLRVLQAVALAGREIEFADKVHITRFVEGDDHPIVIEVSLREAKVNRDANVVLQKGDVVSVEETPTTFVVDFLRNFFRIGFSSAIPGF